VRAAMRERERGESETGREEKRRYIERKVA
jgi:hypothetical protein